jgi:D-mannonate dehydratase
MRQTWRWFGPDDPVTLAHVRQAGAVGIVSALHHLNDGRAWPADEIARRKAEIEAAGLTWDVVESIIVHEDIKTRSGGWRELIDNYKASIRAVGAAGINTVCYNFMASRTGRAPIWSSRCRMAVRRSASMSSSSAPMTFSSSSVRVRRPTIRRRASRPRACGWAR